MQIKPEQLGQQLARGMVPVYLISGDEPLLLDQARRSIIASAEAAGYSERQRLEVQRGFDWAEFAAATQTLSLFGDKRFIELRVGNGKVGDKGSRALTEFADRSDDVVLLITGERFDRAVLNAAWYKKLAQLGVALQVWPMKRADLIRWIESACMNKGLKMEPEGAQLLAGLCEGNSLAAAQEIEKLALMFEPAQSIGPAQVTLAVASSSRYTAFDLVDALADPGSARWTAVLESLRESGIDPLQILGALTWRLRQGGRTRTAGRVAPGGALESLLGAAHRIEAGTKGLSGEPPWPALFDFCLIWRGAEPIGGSG